MSCWSGREIASSSSSLSSPRPLPLWSWSWSTRSCHRGKGRRGGLTRGTASGGATSRAPLSLKTIISKKKRPWVPFLLTLLTLASGAARGAACVRLSGCAYRSGRDGSQEGERKRNWRKDGRIYFHRSVGAPSIGDFFKIINLPDSLFRSAPMPFKFTIKCSKIFRKDSTLKNFTT